MAFSDPGDPAGAETTFVFAVGPLPPPIQGQAATTQHMIRYISHRLPLHISNVSGLELGTLRGRITKSLRVLRAVLSLFLKASGNPRRVLYMAADGQSGIAYNILVALTAKLLRYRIFLHHHSYAYVDAYSTLMACLARVMGKSGTHIVLCNHQAEGLRRRYPLLVQARMMELSSAAFVELTARSEFRRGDDIRIGFLSNLIVEKGLDTSIDLLRAARSEGLPLKLLLAGRSPDRRSADMVRAAVTEFGSAIEYLGPLTEQQKVDFFHDIDAFVFPTRYINEAQPRAILESLFFGVPVLTIARSCITSDVGEMCGICVPLGEDFVLGALPLIRQWSADRDSLARSSQQAIERSIELYETGQRQLKEVVDAFAASA